MSRRTQVTLTDAQHSYLLSESTRSGVSLAELVRRAIDETYRPGDRRRVAGLDLTMRLRRAPDAARLGRRRNLA
jgi:hypothetical protein